MNPCYQCEKFDKTIHVGGTWQLSFRVMLVTMSLLESLSSLKSLPGYLNIFENMNETFLNVKVLQNFNLYPRCLAST